MDRPGEQEASWVLQPTDSLAFSVSPVGPSSVNTSSSQNGGGENNSNYAPSSQSDAADNDNVDDDQPLVGEFIWGDVSDERGEHDHDNEFEDAGQSDTPDFSPTGQYQENNDAHEGLSQAKKKHDSENSSSSRSETQDLGGSNERNEGFFVDPDDRASPSRESPETDEMDREHYEQRGLRGVRHRERDSNMPYGPEYHEHQPDDMLHEQGWVDHEDLEDFADFAPAWDQGRPAADNTHDFDDRSQEPASSSGSSDDRRRAPVRQQDPSDYSASASCYDEESKLSLREEAAPPRPLRRRTRSSLGRERRKLDRIPRSQRLSQVRGHPLGGMTLLELEERHLLDVGIGQMTRLLARRQDKRQRRADADLLRRSARLLRRTQEEREARLWFADSNSAKGGKQHGSNKSAWRDRGEWNVVGQRVRDDRRPASASRGITRPRASSFSLESEDNADWVRIAAGCGRPGSADKRARIGGENSPVGLYSGGGERCSLGNRRPMSAKPALMCRSGWQPGRTRSRRVRESSCRVPESEHSRGRGKFAEPANCGREDMGEELSFSDMSDLSPHGIVEYDEEEDGPFNEDELERVAAAYLLRPGGSFRRSSPADDDDDDRFADDGSVYLYREGDAEEQFGEADWPEDGRRSVDFEADPGRGNVELSERRWRQERSFRRENEMNNCRDDERRSAPGSDRDAEDDSRNRWTNETGFGKAPDKSNRTFSGGDGPNERGVDVKTAGNMTLAGDASVVLGQVEHCGEVGESATQRRNPRKDNSQKTTRRDYSKLSRDGHPIEALTSEAVAPSSNARDSTDMKENGSSRVANPTRHGEQSPETLVPVPDDEGDERLQNRKGCCSQASIQRVDPAALSATGTEHAKLERMAIRLRQMILDRQASTGRSLRQVFGHFDRRSCGYVNAEEMKDSLVDLRFDVSPIEAQDFQRKIAIDGSDRVSYAEFAVFVSDPDYSELQDEVCRQAAAQLEAIGRRSFPLDEMFRRGVVDRGKTSVSWRGSDPGFGHLGFEGMKSSSEARGRDSRGWPNDGPKPSSSEQTSTLRERGSNILSEKEFVVALEALGLQLSAADTQRLLVRFDVHGDGHLSAGRFVSMVERSEPWTRAQAHLARQEEADEEADAYLRARAQRGVREQEPSEDVAEMARYLGIRVSSDASLLWIASDALVAPLPDGWVVHKIQGGRRYFHNELTGASRWDHPLDPHFRNIYLRERFGSDQTDANITVGHEHGCRARGTSGQSYAADWVRGARHAENSTNLSRRLPPTLPPPRVRPNVLDFSSDKALENLRVRRLNGINGDVAHNSSAARPDVPDTSRRGTMDHRDHQVSSIYRESWTSSGLRSPPRPRRRRPASASALRDGLEERTATPNSAGTVNGCSEPTPTLGMTSYGEDEARRRGTVMVTRRRRVAANMPLRPRSAKAALQRPPTSQRQSTQESYRDEVVQDSHPSRNVAAGRHAIQPALHDERWGPPELAADCGHRRAMDDDYRSHHHGIAGRYVGSGHPRVQGAGGASGGARARTPAAAPATEHNFILDDVDTRQMSPAVTAERAWLLERLGDLCRRLGDAEAASGVRYQHRAPASDTERARAAPTAGVNFNRSESDVGHRRDSSPDDLTRRFQSAGGSEDTIRQDEDEGGDYKGDNHRHRDRQSPRRVSTGTLLHHQVSELENRIYHLEGRLQSQGQPSRLRGALEHELSRRAPQHLQPPSSRDCTLTEPPSDMLCDTRSDSPNPPDARQPRQREEEDRRYRHGKLEEGNEIARRHDPSRNEVRTRNTNANSADLKQRWLYEEQRAESAGASLRADSTSSSSSTVSSSSASPLSRERNGGRIEVPGNAASGSKMIGGAATVVERARNEARGGATRRRKSGNPPGIVLI